MLKYRAAQVGIAALLGLGALLFIKIYLIDGWGRLEFYNLLFMACAIALMVIGSIGLFLEAGWGRTASLAFFYLTLAFTLIGAGFSMASFIGILAITMFLVALHAMKPRRGSQPTETGEP